MYLANHASDRDVQMHDSYLVFQSEESAYVQREESRWFALPRTRRGSFISGFCPSTPLAKGRESEVKTKFRGLEVGTTGVFPHRDAEGCGAEEGGVRAFDRKGASRARVRRRAQSDSGARKPSAQRGPR